MKKPIQSGGGATSGMPPSPPHIDLDEIESEVRHLYHLLDTLCDQEGSDPDRSGALLWIARDLAEKCKNMIGGAA